LTHDKFQRILVEDQKMLLKNLLHTQKAQLAKLQSELESTAASELLEQADELTSLYTTYYNSVLHVMDDQVMRACARTAHLARVGDGCEGAAVGADQAADGSLARTAARAACRARGARGVLCALCACGTHRVARRNSPSSKRS
jgi:hypothetical protein